MNIDCMPCSVYVSVYIAIVVVINNTNIMIIIIIIDEVARCGILDENIIYNFIRHVGSHKNSKQCKEMSKQIRYRHRKVTILL